MHKHDSRDQELQRNSFNLFIFLMLSCSMCFFPWYFVSTISYYHSCLSLVNIWIGSSFVKHYWKVFFFLLFLVLDNRYIHHFWFFIIVQAAALLIVFLVSALFHEVCSSLYTFMYIPFWYYVITTVLLGVCMPNWSKSERILHQFILGVLFLPFSSTVWDYERGLTSCDWFAKNWHRTSLIF